MTHPEPLAALNLQPGETYIGGIVAADGTTTHTILLPGDIEADWKAAMAWAKEQGGDLPNRVEQALLFATFKTEFEERAYWSNAECGDGWAWYQTFVIGSQTLDRKYRQLRARAVRRLIIH